MLQQLLIVTNVIVIITRANIKVATRHLTEQIANIANQILQIFDNVRCLFCQSSRFVLGMNFRDRRRKIALAQLTNAFNTKLNRLANRRCQANRNEYTN